MADRLVVLYRGNRPPATGLIERLADTVYATEEELPYLLPGAHALLAWVTITPAIREAWPDNPDKAPRWVHVSSAGVDSFLFPAPVDDPGVVLTNARGVYDQPTAEHVTTSTFRVSPAVTLLGLPVLTRPGPGHRAIPIGGATGHASRLPRGEQ